MKRILFYLFALVYSCQLMAQSFILNNADGIPLKYDIINTNPRQVRLTGRGAIPAGFTGTDLNLPGFISYGGNSYQVVEIGEQAFFTENKFTNLHISEGVLRLKAHAIARSHCVSITLPSSLEKIEDTEMFSSETLKYVYGLENTKITELPGNTFASCYVLEYVKLPSQLQVIGDYCFIQTNLTALEIPATVKKIGIWAFMMSKIAEFDIPASVEEIGWGAFTSNNVSKIRMHRAIPPTASGQLFYNLTNLSVFVPTEATLTYETTAHWADLKGVYREEVKIGTSGYATLYLETENFEVPTGCEAFVIESIVPSATPGERKKANAKKFVAGSIIPAGQAVILKGTAGQTYEYKANVSGTPVTIAQNLLVGTATEQTLNAPGYKYFLFGSGPNGQGFYRQTGHDISSIHLKAHKAGLRIPASVAGSAKAFIIDFDEAEDGSVTAIRDIETDNHRPDIIYNLQGQRVTHPEKGIYIVNGKKKVY
ncbi:leucine-rich repeat domain-containing protein [Hoylesella marshii]|uniref:Leucine-rich repeat domain-containing protein n=1 Tax=Hoylesella marshii DSM 16973 = JCM 13450 TaxID=862515 RepID=E0NPE8_9BACT|nr:leucine-rich repeat domain-containing protein [Hoylesella marshii]EFM02907.1 hypothetical protein HMPREF0658_0049 [Hoylesella marshii DSM 16973 = JCM 13450]